jgi:hypothetical protein
MTVTVEKTLLVQIIEVNLEGDDVPGNNTKSVTTYAI